MSKRLAPFCSARKKPQYKHIQVNNLNLKLIWDWVNQQAMKI